MEYTLNINLNGSTDKDKAKESLSKTIGQEASTGVKNTNEAKQKFDKEDKDKTTDKIVGFEVAKKAAQKVITTTVSTYGSHTGDAATQNLLNNAVSVGAEGAKITALVATQNWAALALEAVSQVVTIGNRIYESQQISLERALNETRQSERLGIVASKRNRGR